MGTRLIVFLLMMISQIETINSADDFCPFPDPGTFCNECLTDDDCKNNGDKTKCCYNAGCCLISTRCQKRPFQLLSPTCNTCNADETCGSGMSCCKTIKNGCCMAPVKIQVPEKRKPDQESFCVTVNDGATLTVSPDSYYLQCNRPEDTGTDACKADGSSQDNSSSTTSELSSNEGGDSLIRSSSGTSPTVSNSFSTSFSEPTTDPVSTLKSDSTSTLSSPSTTAKTSPTSTPSSPTTTAKTSPTTQITTRPTTSPTTRPTSPSTTQSTTKPTTRSTTRSTTQPTTRSIWDSRCPSLSKPLLLCLECNPLQKTSCPSGMICCRVPQRSSGCCLNLSAVV